MNSLSPPTSGLSASASASASASPTSTASTSVTRHPCISCQRHKVKCDRRSPCSRCLTHGKECRQPDAQRAPRRPPRKSHDVLDRVRQLEASLDEMRTLLKRSAVAEQHSTAEAAVRHSNSVKEEPESLDTSLGHLIIDDDRSRYVSTTSWANLTDEISDLKSLLDNDGLHESDLYPSSTRLVSAAIIHSEENSPESASLQIGIDVLWQIFVRNVAPCMEILHIPSMQTLITNTLSGVLEPTKGTYCIFAAIKFAAVTSLTDEECWTLGSSRRSLLRLYGAEVHETLDNANFLTSHTLITLQAFVIFLICNRRHEQPRALWISVGIAIRLAESLGVHRDGASMKLPVLVTELRRRLWWEIRMLDVICAEDCGFSHTHVYGEDARLPLNINDADITLTDSTPPTERTGYTEMTYSLIRFEICNRLHGFQTHQGKESMGPFTVDKHQVGEQSRALAECKAALETQIFQHCSPTDPMQRMAKKLGQLMLSKLYLIVHHPLFQNHHEFHQASKELKDQLFVKSCEVIELGHEMIHDPETSACGWHIQTYVHWHPVAYLLRQICSTMPSEQIERAWKAVKLGITDPHGLSADENRAIWKPLESLVVRAKAKVQHLGLDSDLNDAGLQRGFDLQYLGGDEFSTAQGASDQWDPLTTSQILEPQGYPSSKEGTSEPGALGNDMNLLDNPLGDAAEGPFPTAQDLMPFDLYQPFMTMDDFMADAGGMQPSFDEAWWNENIGAIYEPKTSQ